MFDKFEKWLICAVIPVILVVGAQPINGENIKADGNIRFGGITGQLTDKYTKQPLVGADVIIMGTSMVTVSDIDGKFSFDTVQVGGYSLKFSFPGMVPQVVTDIIVKSKRVTVVIAEIQLISETSESVTVTAGYFETGQEDTGNPVTFSNEEIRRAPGSGGDVSRIIASLPSVARVNDQVNNLAVRGGSTNENLFLIDNIPVPNINHFPLQGSAGGAISLINVDFIRDVDFFAGGFSAIYGDRLSSVMNLTLREGSRDGLSGQLSMDFGGAGLSAEGPLFGPHGSWMVSARRSYLDLLVEVLDAGAAVQYSDLLCKAVYDFSPNSKLTVLGIAGIDKSNVSREDAVDLGETIFGDSSNKEYTVGINWFHMWGDNAYSNTSLSHSFTRFDYDFFKTATSNRYLRNDSEDHTWHLRNVNNIFFSRVFSLKTGFELNHGISRYEYHTASSIDSLGNPVAEVRKNLRTNASKIAVFAEYSIKFLSRLTLNLGVRAGYFTYNKKVNVSPRGSLNFQVSRRTSIRASAGVFRQNLPPLLLYRNESNKTLDDPSAVQYVVSLKHLLSSSTRLSLEGYYKEYRHFAFDPARGTLCLLDDLFGFDMFGDGALADSGKARSYGIELVLQKKLKEKIYGMVSGSFFRSQYRGSDGKWRGRIFDNKYIFSLQGGYKPNRKWEFSIRWIIAGGMPYTPFDEERSRAVNSGIYDETRVNALRLPSYHSLNLRFDRRFHFSGSNLMLYVSVWNAYNRKNTANYYWNEIENKPDFSYQFSLLPILGIEFEF